jgi:glutamyl-tRNA reductase
VRDVRVAHALRRLGHLEQRDREIVEALADRITAELLHRPTVALRTDPALRPHVARLFGLEASE